MCTSELPAARQKQSALPSAFLLRFVRVLRCARASGTHH